MYPSVVVVMVEGMGGRGWGVGGGWWGIGLEQIELNHA